MEDASSKQLTTEVIDEQLAELLGPLGIQSEMTLPNTESGAVEQTEEGDIRVSTHYLHLVCPKTMILAVLAKTVSFLQVHQGDATCIAHPITRKQHQGVIVVVSDSPFTDTVMNWIGTQTSIEDYYSYCVSFILR